jgi:prolyl-tRNA editing enzyme YbaK/EbsC (Cys-tRNA(Pro) deacylase)
MPVWLEEELLEFDTIYINGGRRGYLLGINPQVLIDKLGARPVQAGLEKG